MNIRDFGFAFILMFAYCIWSGAMWWEVPLAVLVFLVSAVIVTVVAIELPRLNAAVEYGPAILAAVFAIAVLVYPAVMDHQLAWELSGADAYVARQLRRTRFVVPLLAYLGVVGALLAYIWGVPAMLVRVVQGRR
ncbi:MAG: hypothetical protein HKM24_04605 [Gammaproteobacteria bacterium]|nr:hypothetical protein [Gammaproteobacteria bacterium]